MLHLQRYREEQRGGVREAFRTIFDNSELTYFDKSGFDGPSIIGLDGDGVVQAFILKCFLLNVVVLGLIMMNYFQYIIQVFLKMVKVKFGHVTDVLMVLNVKKKYI